MTRIMNMSSEKFWYNLATYGHNKNQPHPLLLERKLFNIENVVFCKQSALYLPDLTKIEGYKKNWP